MIERIGRNTPGTEGHLARYYLASGFMEAGDVALDAACGIGYGSKIMSKFAGTSYVGVDRHASPDFADFVQPWVRFEVADLLRFNPDFDFDVFVGFETIEHLPEIGHYLDLARGARKWAIMSAPVVPTKHFNEHHLRDFAPGEVPRIFLEGHPEWGLFQTLGQPSEVSEIYVFRRSP